MNQTQIALGNTPFRSDPNSSIIRRPAIKNGSSAILWKRGRGILGSTYAREFGKHGPR